MSDNEDMNLVDLAVAQQPTAFMDAVNSILHQKAVSALEQIRPVIAQSIYNGEDEDDDTSEDQGDDEDDTYDDDDDIDIDDEDIDLEDIDWDSLEGLEDDDQDA